ncbi:MAG: hypothetical protein HY397_01955 [Candidatus Doudnabacteria bacterium]|nr:hypothetical protein [Candidatus Doudnabacteria bacterium]
MSSNLTMLMAGYFLVFATGFLIMLFTVSTYSPAELSRLLWVLLYASVGLVAFSLSGFLAILLLRLRMGLRAVLTRHTHRILRQSFLIAAICVFALYLQSARELTFFTAAMLVVAGGLLELYFLNSNR